MRLYAVHPTKHVVQAFDTDYPGVIEGADHWMLGRLYQRKDWVFQTRAEAEALIAILPPGIVAPPVTLKAREYRRKLHLDRLKIGEQRTFKGDRQEYERLHSAISNFKRRRWRKGETRWEFKVILHEDMSEVIVERLR